MERRQSPGRRPGSRAISRPVLGALRDSLGCQAHQPRYERQPVEFYHAAEGLRWKTRQAPLAGDGTDGDPAVPATQHALSGGQRHS